MKHALRLHKCIKSMVRIGKTLLKASHQRWKLVSSRIEYSVRKLVEWEPIWSAIEAEHRLLHVELHVRICAAATAAAAAFVPG